MLTSCNVKDIYSVQILGFFFKPLMSRNSKISLYQRKASFSVVLKAGDK